jgi:hypothetical protein
MKGLPSSCQILDEPVFGSPIQRLDDGINGDEKSDGVSAVAEF